MSEEREEPASALARHRAFWRGEQTDRPLAGAYLGGYEVADVYLVAGDGDLLEPQQLVPERFLEVFVQRCEKSEGLGQDLFRPLSPLYCVPWLEAMLGCPVRVHSQACWAESLLDEDEPLETLQPGWTEAWLEAAVSFVWALAARANCQPSLAGGFPVAGLFLRGPADVVAAMLGTERMCYEFYDHPRQYPPPDPSVRRCLDRGIAPDQPAHSNVLRGLCRSRALALFPSALRLQLRGR